MRSYQQFTPGKKSNDSKLILYSNLQDVNVCPNYNCTYENLTNPNYDSNSNFSNLSGNRRIAQVLSSTLGGKLRFGNFYLNEPINVNYLGRTPGQPGGSGRPLRNW
jgi:hypothetical protein